MQHKKLLERETLAKANRLILNSTKNYVKIDDVVKAAHLMSDLYKANMTHAEYKEGIDVYYWKHVCNQVAHSDGPTPHAKGFNPYHSHNEPTTERELKERERKERLAWDHVGTAIALFEACYYPR